MAGILLVILVLLYIGITLFLLVIVKPIWLKPLVLIIAYLIPNADDAYYRNRFDIYCKTQAGYKVYEHASKSAGLVDDFVTRAQDFPTFIELTDIESHDAVMHKLHHFHRQSDGSIQEIDIDKLSIPYEILRTEINTENFIEAKVQIIQRDTRKTLSEWKNLNYYGGWFKHGLLGSLADSGPTLVASCEASSYAYSGEMQLIKQTFSID